MTRRLGHLPAALLACAVLALVAVPAGWLWRGAGGAFGALLGVALVVVSYLVSGLAVAWADSVAPRLVMSVGLVTYGLKFLVLGVVLVSIAGLRWPGLAPMAAAIVATVAVWCAAQFWWTWRST